MKKKPFNGSLIPIYIAIKEVFLLYKYLCLLLLLTCSCYLSCGDDPTSTNDNDTDTKETGTMPDIDGNTYQTIKIGDQWWMAENLKVTHYRNGWKISGISDTHSG